MSFPRRAFCTARRAGCVVASAVPCAVYRAKR
jgi:hypothetical protein